MALDHDHIVTGLRALSLSEPIFAHTWEKMGTPVPRIRPTGYTTLLQTIVSQQISTAAAATVWQRLQDQIGDVENPEVIAAATPETLRTAGLSRQKIEYAKDLAEHVLQGKLPLHQLPEDDEDAISLLTAVRGLGRWSAEIYLLFAEGRTDIFPAGDLALQVQAGRMFGEAGARLTEGAVRRLAHNWSPHRAVAALFLWHCYNGTPL